MDVKIWYFFRGVGSVIAGALTWLYGELNGMLIALLVAIVTDYITGIIKGAVKKKLDSNVGFIGILRKVLILVMVALAHLLDEAVGTGDTWRNMIIAFYLSNEFLSIIENCSACGLPVPKGLKKFLADMKKDNEAKKETIKKLEGGGKDGNKDNV